MRAVVFGGAGFIGTHLMRDLCASGVEVVCADIVEPAQAPTGVDFIRCDVREKIGIPHGVPFDLVYNLAAIHRTPGHEPFEYYETNVTGAQNIVDWCTKGAEKRLIFTSSIAVYGPGEDAKSETTTPKPNSDYGRSKLLAEGIHRRWQEAVPSTRRLTVVRPAVVFGPGESGNFTRLAHALKRRRFLYAGRTDTIKSCGYVTDLIRALRFADDIQEGQFTFNYCYPARSTIGEICEAFHEVAGYARPRTLPPGLMVAALGALRLLNPNDRGGISAARVVKLTASTNIVATALLARGFEWETDLRAALHRWSSATEGQFV